ncbi:MAG: hypothetical protein LBB40_02440 [Holophagales bacterium]|nr:hypothetical protein [Holophagales bacterium]
MFFRVVESYFPNEPQIFMGKILVPVAKRQFCNFNGVDRLCQNEAGRYFGAEGEMGGADRNGVLKLPHLCRNQRFSVLRYLTGQLKGTVWSFNPDNSAIRSKLYTDGTIFT